MIHRVDNTPETAIHESSRNARTRHFNCATLAATVLVCSVLATVSSALELPGTDSGKSGEIEAREKQPKEKAPAASKKKDKSKAVSEIWEFSPYSVNVWIAYDFFPEYSEELHRLTVEKLTQYAAVDDQSGWQVSAEKAPEHLRFAIENDLESFAFNEAELQQPDILDGDKLMLVAVSRTDEALRVTTREYDCRLEQYSSAIYGDVVSSEQLPAVIYQTIRRAFVPLARVTSVDDKQAIGLVRAGGLLMAQNDATGNLEHNLYSPAWIRAESICEPIQSRSIRSKGKTVKQTTVVEWTFGVVDELLNLDKAPEISCSLYSAMRTPLGGKRGSRSERTLRVCKPNYDETVLTLTDREDPPQAAAGYAIYKVVPGAEDSSELLGKTDWNGQFKVDTRQEPLVLLYVRSGSRTLARLPIVPGQEANLTAAMFSDAVRLRAEGIVRGMQSNLLNLIAQRQSLSVQIQVALENGEVDQAQGLMNNFSQLQTGDAFLSSMEAQAASLNGKDAREQTKIDKMFSQLRKLVSKHLTSEMNVKLTADIEYVRSGNDILKRDAAPSAVDELKAKENEKAQKSKSADKAKE